MQNEQVSLENAASGWPALSSPTLAISSSFVPTYKILCRLSIALKSATDNFMWPAVELGIDDILPS